MATAASRPVATARRGTIGVATPLGRRGFASVAALGLSLIALFVTVRPVTSVTSGMVLNDYVRHFEPLFYDHEEFRLQHGRIKRQTNPELRLQFTAHNRLFKIRLKRSTSVFTDDVVLESTTGPVDFDMNKVYDGQLEDDDQSTVSAVLTSNGYFDGTVTTPMETYYIEPADRYFRPGKNVTFPAVIYKASDVVHPDQLLDRDHGCASHQLYLKQFEESLVEKRSAHYHHHHHHSTNQSSSPVIQQQSCTTKKVASTATPPTVDWPSSNQVIDRTLYSGWNRHDPANHDRVAKRRGKQRRSTVDPRKTTCMLYLQADHLFYSKMGSEEACIESMTRHVQRVNSIYKNVDFDGDGFSDEINFMIKRIKVHTEQALNDASYRFPGNYGVEKFLELFSEEDYNAFCLAYMFTYRDFEGGTLGLAWTGDLKNAGGVCEKNGHYRGSLKSLNTGIVTLLNYGKHVPPAVSHVTLAHEIGHNFGSPHDPENNRDCTPGGEDGNYIMFARATSGDKRNNNKFSPCSLKSINGVLSAKARNDQGCFTEPQTAICGNGVVEAGEECDCGWEDDCHEKCCFPMRSVQVLGERPCTLRPSSRCSPSQGPCCTDECQLRYGAKCRDDNGCRDSAYCDGSGPRCPPSINKPNKTVCNEEFVCFMGECTGSICIAYGLQSCQCLQGPNDPPTKACELCCKLPGDDQPCLSSFEWNTAPYDVPDAHAKAGTPCNNYNGYCDVFQRCREVDPSGPLATLRRLLLSDESIASLKRWVEDHWYGVLFIAVGFITVIVAIVRVFGKRVQRKMRQRHRTSRTTTGLTTAAAAAAANAALDDFQGQHIVHPVAVRNNIPFKKKVREKDGKRSRKTPGHSSSHHRHKALAVFSKPIRSKHRRSSGDHERRRRSGIVNTKDKVQSWLERENPTHEAVDSDNESHFPEEQISQPPAATNDAPAPAKTDSKRHSVRQAPNESKEQHSRSENVSSDSADGRKRSRTDLLAIPSLTPGGSKTMRSISETTHDRKNQHHFARSISHDHEPDFHRLNRKTDSHSHLLSKLELEQDEGIKSSPDKDNLGVDHVAQRMEPATHPAVEKHIPNAANKIHKSATEGHLIKSSERETKSRFQSFEFLSILSGRKGGLKDDKISGLAKKTPTRPLNEDSAKIRKKIGIGPVKVVLKWHGNSRLKSKRSNHAKIRKDEKTGRQKPPKKKRVIVYQNGNPTTYVSNSKVNDQSALTASATDAILPEKKLPVNITANPLEPVLETDYGRQSNAVFPSRRYSMQEHRLAPPTLMRHLSEVQSPSEVASPPVNDNRRRNRHSWTVGNSVPEIPHVKLSSSRGHVNIAIDDQDDIC